MISRRYIEEWKEYAPWPEDAQVEHDLVIEKALQQIYSSPFLYERLAFRGGTALHKLFLKPQVRYSEDLDFVQIKAEPIKETLSELRKQLQFLGKPEVRQKVNNNTLIYRFMSEIPPSVNLRLKIEINCREHFTVLGYKDIEYHFNNTWTNGVNYLKTFNIEEMLGTKLRALYQRKKGRDLFDLHYAITQIELDTDLIVDCYKKHISLSLKNPPSKKEYLINLEKKIEDPDFTGDIYALLRPGIDYNQSSAFALIRSTLIEKI